MLPRSALLIFFSFAAHLGEAGEPLPGTQFLPDGVDRSAEMVRGIHDWLERATSRANAERPKLWQKDSQDPDGWVKVAELRRAELAKMIGVVDVRKPGALTVQVDPAGTMTAVQPGSYAVRRVRWPVFEGVHGEGLILLPAGPAKSAVIALPDADQTPEQFAGIQPGIAPELQHARQLAERGFLVIVPVLVDRRDEWSGSERLQRYTNAPHREWIHRQCFESGRTLIGFEVQKVLAAVDALTGPSAKLLADGAKIGVLGHGEGGLIALHAAALDPRLGAVLVHGYFGAGESDEVIYRNVFGCRVRFSDAGLAALISPRPFGVMRGDYPIVSGPPAVRDGRKGAAPGSLAVSDEKRLSNAINEADPYRGWLGATPVKMVEKPEAFMAVSLGVQPDGEWLHGVVELNPADAAESERQRRSVWELEEFSQRIFRESEAVRKASPLWTRVKPGPEWEAVQKQARADFWEKVIGKLPTDYLPPNPRTRLVHDEAKWRGYEVMLDVHPQVSAWGLLLLPKDLQPGERRPVVVCQHGLEGLPEDTIIEDQTSHAWRAYKAFAARLCERGFIVYAPHNPYRGGDDFRKIQRVANPLGLTLFSFIIAQHDVTTRWLASLPFVDSERIAFYGLSYGGKTAMRVPAVLERYCLSICSGDFNEWVLKCVSNLHPASYIFTGEWEIWEWDLAHTFNYAEMALLIAPRPFMVERGHDDGVGLDEHVGYEFAKVRRGYDKLGIGDRAEIEWFDGPHTINGVGTFKFLHKWLRWPEPK